MSTNAPDKFILTLNGGSSSLKFALFVIDANLSRKLSGSVDRIGLPGGKLVLQPPASAPPRTVELVAPTHAQSVALILSSISEHADLSQLARIGHRIVHSGPSYSQPVVITPA